MEFSKPLLLFLTGALLTIFCSTPANSQKKDGKNNPPVVSLTPSTPYSNVKRDFLLNGLQIISFERPTDRVVKVDIVIRAGAMFDLVGKIGIAKLTQEALLAANPRLKEEVESLQAKIDWGINWDTTWFHIETPAANFDTVLEIVGRLLVVENIRTEAFKRAQQEELERIKSKQLSPAERADESFLRALYGDHPYGHSIDGTEATMANIKPGDIFDFVRRFYIANNASIVTAGNIPHERVMRVFKIFFGGWVKSQIVPATFRPPKQIAQLNVIKIEDPDAQNVELRAGVLGVKHSDPDFLTTEVIARVLESRLKKSAEVPAGNLSVKPAPRVLAGPLFLSATLMSEQAPAFLRRVTESFAALATTAVPPEELATAKSSLANERASLSVEYNLREIEVYGLPRNSPTTVAQKIEAITVLDVQRVAKKLLDANALTVVALGRVNEKSF